MGKQPEKQSTQQKSESTIRRKSEHLRIVASRDVTHANSTLLEDIQLLHQALPEMSLDDVTIETEFFGKRLSAPLMITSMTGGTEFSESLNMGLAEVAENEGIAFGVGSQRVMLRHPEVAGHFKVRPKMPTGVLLANIGAVQLEEYTIDSIVRLMTDIDADGICVHLNAAQELIQNEGQHDFSGLVSKIKELVNSTGGRVLVKETGAGLSPETLETLDSIGVKYIDVAGAGGTSWTKVEMHRAESEKLRNRGKTLADWGIPTAFSLIAARKLCSTSTKIIASGGITNGLEAAKCIAVGADIVGIARMVLLRFLENGVAAATEYIRQVKDELKTTMLLVGARDVASLRNKKKIYTGTLREWLVNFGWA